MNNLSSQVRELERIASGKLPKYIVVGLAAYTFKVAYFDTLYYCFDATGKTYRSYDEAAASIASKI